MISKTRNLVIVLAIAAILVIAAGILLLGQIEVKEAALGEVDPGMPGVEDLTAEWNNGCLEVFWEKPDGDITGYEVWHSAGADRESDYELAATIEDPDIISYSDPEASEYQVDFYKIRAYKKEKKLGILDSLSFGAASDGINSVETAEQIPIISYHHLCDADLFDKITEYSTLYVPDDDFDKQMKWLKDNGWRTLSNEEVAAWHRGDIELPHKSTMVTFDDGCYSVIKYGLPSIRKYGLKATIFIIGAQTPEVTDTEPYDVYKYNALGKDVIEEVRASYPDFEFQSHTYSMHDRIDGHKPLNVMTKEEMVQDVARMNEEFGCNSIAYPWGKYNKDLYSALEENGNYIIGYTYGSNHYAKRSQERFALKRIKIKGGRPMDKFIRWYDGSMDNID